MSKPQLPEASDMKPIESFSPPSFVSLDIEGLGFGPYCSIVEVGISLFHQGRGFLTFSEKVVPDYNRAEKDTLDWWSTQPGGGEYLQSCEDEGNSTLSKALAKLEGKFAAHGRPMSRMPWYFRGPAYDQAAIQHQLAVISSQCIWAHHSCLCQRTLETEAMDLGFSREGIYREANLYLQCSAAPEDLLVRPPSQVAHRAGDDAFHQGVSILGCKALMYRMYRASLKPPTPPVETGIQESTKECYQCENPAPYLFDDGRCVQCTRLAPEEIKGEGS